MTPRPFGDLARFADATASNGLNTVRTFDPTDWTVERAIEAKRGRTVSVCIPCKNEAETIGPIVAMMRSTLMGAFSIVDELIVIDDNSTDDTAQIASDSGATVVSINTVNEAYGKGRGKGNALWASVLVSTGDFIVWCDGDVTSVEASWVVRLLMPLITTDDVALVKASYHRPTDLGGGGRTTELVARPLLSLFLPELTGLHQPLSGEFAGRRSMMETIPFVQGWGVEIAMLADIASTYGPSAIAQIDVGERRHRHQSLDSLGVQAAEVTATLLSRIDPTLVFAHQPAALLRPNGAHQDLNLSERPPVADVTGGQL